MSFAYKASGVDIDAGKQFVQMIKARVARAWEGVGDQIDGFAGEIQLQEPVRCIKAGADGSGTVAILAALMGRFDVIDVGRLVPEEHIGIIDGLIRACKSLRKRCVLLGGETAELPDMFKHPWMVNVNTTAIAVPDSNIATGRVQPGHVVYGWRSDGPASNGFSLIRQVFGLKKVRTACEKLQEEYPELGGTLADALLVPAPMWAGQIEIQRERMVAFSAHAHITGGGLVDNVPRVLPDNCKVVLDRSTWQRPPIFGLIEQLGRISEEDMDRTFNQGIMVVSIVDPSGHEPDTPNMIPIGQVERRQGEEPQVQLTGTFS